MNRNDIVVVSCQVRAFVTNPRNKDLGTKLFKFNSRLGGHNNTDVTLEFCALQLMIAREGGKRERERQTYRGGGGERERERETVSDREGGRQTDRYTEHDS